MDELDSTYQTVYNGLEYNFVQVVFLANGQELRPQLKLDGVAFELFGYQKFRREKHHPFNRIELIPNGGRIVVVVGGSSEEVDTVLPGPPNYPTGIVNVRAFGAAGDGVTDDTAVIQAAATSAAGSSLRFPKGNYRLTGHITLQSNTRVEAEGAVTITQVTPGEIVFYGQNVSNVQVRGFNLVGPGSATQPTGTASSQNWGAITFETSGGSILVENNTISGFFNGITGTSLTGFTVRNNEVSHWRFYGVLASISSDFHVDNNRLHDNDMPVGAAWSGAVTYALGDTATANAFMWMSLQNGNLNHAPPAGPPGDAFWLQIATYGIMATGARTTTGLQSRNTIAFNKILNNPVWDAIMSHDCDGLIIVGNDARGVRNGIDLSSSTAGKYIDKVVIEGNYFEATATDAWSGAAAKNTGISLFGNDATIAARNVVISGNVINGFNAFNAGSQANGGISLSNTLGITVIGNRVLNVGAFAGNVGGGIVANGTGNGMVISGNTIETSSGLPVVLLNALTSDAVSIAGNSLRDGNGTANAVKVAGPCVIGNLSITGNTTNCTKPYATSGATSTLSQLLVDWQSTNSVVSQEGGTGAVVQKMIAPSSGLTNIDLLSMDLSGTASSSMAVEIEVTGIVSQATGLVRWVFTAYGTRTTTADAVWTPAVATAMFVDSHTGGNPANALGAVYGAITAPKVVINQVAPSLGTLQFQPQVGFAAYFIRVKATAWRSIATAL